MTGRGRSQSRTAKPDAGAPTGGGAPPIVGGGRGGGRGTATPAPVQTTTWGGAPPGIARPGTARPGTAGGTEQLQATPSAWGPPPGGSTGRPPARGAPATVARGTAEIRPGSGAQAPPSAWGSVARPPIALAAVADRGTAADIRPGSAPTAPVVGLGRATSHRGGATDTGAPPLASGGGRGSASAAAAAAAAAPADAATAAANVHADRGMTRGSRVLADILRTRPQNLDTKKGNKGVVVRLHANYFRLEKSTTWNLYQYRVDFAPSVELAGLRNRLMFEQKATLGGYLFDGTVMFCAKRLPNDVNEIMCKDRDENPIQITIRFVGLVSMNTAASLQVLNLILRRAMGGLHLQLVGRNLFDALAKVDVHEHKLQLWPGYVTSIRQHEYDLLLCAEMSCKVMRTETLLEIMQEVYRESRNFKQEFLNRVLGMTVLTDYNNKTYRIDDVNFDENPMSTFASKRGETQISYQQYYRDKYNITIRDLKQPLLLSKVRERDIRGKAGEEMKTSVVALVPELCRATGMSERMRANFHLMTAISQYTRLAPADRIGKLLSFNKRLRTTPESRAVLDEWNLKLSEEMMPVSGRKLDAQTLVFGNGRTSVVSATADWSREFHNQPMFSSVPLKNWAAICPRMCEQETRGFADCLLKVSSGMNYPIGKANVFVIPDDRMLTIQRAIDEAMNGDPQLIMVVVPNNNADKYAAIKKKCCVERPIATQVMLSKTIKMRPGKERNLLSVATKVLIQINCKLGGAAWMTTIPGPGIMTIGFDVCHDNRDRNKSYGAMVATMDLKQSSKYFSAVTAHTNGEELSNEFSVNVTKALKQYRDEHGALPNRILVYRDGVGEGQTDYVYQHEVVVLRKKLDEIYKTANVEQGYRMAFIIVSKRINTRFFLDGRNPMPGTVVDDVVTLPERYDFFLISQSSRIGTVSPTSYNVISDNSGLSPNQLQEFSYKMTHLYYNWTGTLRVPAVCQYAHKLAYLVGQYIHQSPSNLLEKQLYFI